MSETLAVEEAAPKHGLGFLATGLSLHLWRQRLGTLGVAGLLGMAVASARHVPAPGAGGVGGAPGVPAAYAFAGVVFALLVLSVIGLDVVGCVFCCKSPVPGRKASAVAAPVPNLAAVAATYLLLVIDPRNDLHVGLVGCGVITLAASGESLFLRFLATAALGVENPGAAAYASGTRRLWHVPTPMVVLTLVLATLDAPEPGVFRVYLVAVLTPSLALAAWFWVHRAKTLGRVRRAGVARADRVPSSVGGRARLPPWPCPWLEHRGSVITISGADGGAASRPRPCGTSHLSIRYHPMPKKLAVSPVALSSVAGLCLSLSLALPVTADARAADGPREIEAERIVLKDKNGKVRLTLGVRDDGNAEVSFQDADGKTRMKLGLGDDAAPTVVLQDREGKARVRVTSGADGTPLVTLCDAAGKSRLDLTTRPDGRGVAVVRDPDGKERVTVGTSTSGRSVVTLFDQNQKPRLSLGADVSAGAAVAALDENAKERIKMLYDPRGFSRFTTFDAQGKTRLNAVHSDTAAAFNVLDPAGKVRASYGAAQDGRPRLLLNDNGGANRLAMELNPDSTVNLSLYGPANKLLFGLGAKDDRAGLTCFDPEGRPRLGLGLGADQSPALRLYDSTSKFPRLALSVLPENGGTPILSLIDRKGADRVGMVMTKDDLPMIGLRDAAGTDRAVVGVRADGYPILVLNGRTGAERVALAVAPDETSFLRLRGANDQQTFHAP